jgi:hypothetical protein
MTAETGDQASGDLNLVKSSRGRHPEAAQERAWCDVLSEVSSDVIYQILLRRFRCCGRCRTIPNNFSFLHHK